MKSTIYALFTLLIYAATASAQTTEGPGIPLEKLEHYTASIFYEELESMKLERLKLEGPQTIITDILPAHITVDNDKSVSLLFKRAHDPRSLTSLYIFPSAEFGGTFSTENLNAYLLNKQLSTEEHAQFTILEKAAQTTGPAKFRILGRRATSMAYQFKNESETMVVCGENWAEIDGRIYVVRIEAPKDTFDYYFRLVKNNLNSMYIAD